CGRDRSDTEFPEQDRTMLRRYLLLRLQLHSPQRKRRSEIPGALAGQYLAPEGYALPRAKSSPFARRGQSAPTACCHFRFELASEVRARLRLHRAHAAK